MALPCGTTGSLCPTFVPVRLVCLTVKRPCAIALYARLPSVLRTPLEASVTLLEATTPVKLPTTHCSPFEVRPRTNEGWYFNNGSPIPSETGSQPPSYPTHPLPRVNTKL
jgi:hypothetical protein